MIPLPCPLFPYKNLDNKIGQYVYGFMFFVVFFFHLIHLIWNVCRASISVCSGCCCYEIFFLYLSLQEVNRISLSLAPTLSVINRSPRFFFMDQRGRQLFFFLLYNEWFSHTSTFYIPICCFWKVDIGNVKEYINFSNISSI